MDGKECHVAMMGDFLKGYPLEIDGKTVSGVLWCADDDNSTREFTAFYPYTSLEGFAAYKPVGAPDKIILVNKSTIQFIYFK